MALKPLEQMIDDLIRGQKVVVYVEPQPQDPADPESNNADFALCPPNLLTPMLNHDVLFLLDFSCDVLEPGEVKHVQDKLCQKMPAVEDSWYLATLTMKPLSGANCKISGNVVTNEAPFMLEHVFLNFIW